MDGSHFRAVGTGRWLVRLSLVGCIAMVLTLLMATRVSATSIDPLTWEELVIGSDFLGVVECKTAGGIVAKYEVIEGWKGAEAGKVVSIRVEPDIHGPQFPIALCGERYLIAAYKTTLRNTRGMRTLPFPHANPLWWRELSADFRTPLFQGWDRLGSPGGSDLKFRFGSPHGSLEEFRKEALKLLGLSPEQQEERVLHALFAKRDRRVDRHTEDYLADVRSQMETAAGAAKLVDILILEMSEGAKETKWTIRSILSEGGGMLTLTALEKLLVKRRPLESEMRDYVTGAIHSIRSRLGMPMRHQASVQPIDALASGYWGATVENMIQSQYTFEGLEADRAYKEAFQFALHCTNNREEQFKKLLSAKDSFVRVTGAVYLCIENRELGMEKLRELTKLEGDPGVWAALNLARRGDKAEMERALEVFATKDDRGRDGNLHGHLQDRVLVLLSNTANHSGLPQPGRAVPEPGSRHVGSPQLYAQYHSWWKTYGARAVPFDPWLESLEKQKVD